MEKASDEQYQAGTSSKTIPTFNKKIRGGK